MAARIRWARAALFPAFFAPERPIVQTGAALRIGVPHQFDALLRKTVDILRHHLTQVIQEGPKQIFKRPLSTFSTEHLQAATGSGIGLIQEGMKRTVQVNVKMTQGDAELFQKAAEKR